MEKNYIIALFTMKTVGSSFSTLFSTALAFCPGVILIMTAMEILFCYSELLITCNVKAW